MFKTFEQFFEALYLVPISCTEASYHLPMTCSSLTHSSCLVPYGLPILVCFLIPIVLLIACILDHPYIHFTYIIFHLHHYQKPYASL